MKLKNGLGLVQKKSKLLRFKIDHYLPYLRPHVQLLNNSWRNIFRLQHRNPSVSDLELHFPKVNAFRSLRWTRFGLGHFWRTDNFQNSKIPVISEWHYSYLFGIKKSFFCHLLSQSQVFIPFAAFLFDITLSLFLV